MGRITNAEINPDYLKIEYKDHLALLTFGEAGFHLIDDLNTGGLLFSLLDNIEKDPDIYGIMIFNSEVSFDRAHFQQFVERASGVDLSVCGARVTTYQNPVIRTREVIFLQRLIIKLMSLEKVVVRCITDEVSTPMVSLALACDMRFMADTARFVFPHVDFGIHPAGGLPFFLQRYIGHGKSMEILLRGNDMSAQEALQLNVVNKVFSEKNFRQTCINDVSGLCELCSYSIKKTKRIMKFTVEDLKRYFDLEAKQLA